MPEGIPLFIRQNAKGFRRRRYFIAYFLQKFPPQIFHSIFSSALRAKTYSENIAMKYLRCLDNMKGERNRFGIVFPPQAFHGIFSSEVSAADISHIFFSASRKTYSENIAARNICGCFADNRRVKGIGSELCFRRRHSMAYFSSEVSAADIS